MFRGNDRSRAGVGAGANVGHMVTTGAGHMAMTIQTSAETVTHLKSDLTFCPVRSEPGDI